MKKHKELLSFEEAKMELNKSTSDFNAAICSGEISVVAYCLCMATELVVHPKAIERGLRLQEEVIKTLFKLPPEFDLIYQSGEKSNLAKRYLGKYRSLDDGDLEGKHTYLTPKDQPILKLNQLFIRMSEIMGIKKRSILLDEECTKISYLGKTYDIKVINQRKIIKILYEAYISGQKEVSSSELYEKIGTNNQYQNIKKEFRDKTGQALFDSLVIKGDKEGYFKLNL